MKLEPNKPVETREPAIDVDAGLTAGQHRLQLVVVNDRGVESAPAVLVVTILQPVIIIPRGGNPG